MLPGPDYIIACPYCGENVRKQSLMSANTFGAACWSDGFMMAPMYPDLPLVVRCQNCQGFYNAETAKEIKELPFDGSNDDKQEIAYVGHLKPEEYPHALASDVSTNPDIEKYLRTRYWWEMNHKCRFRSKAKHGFAVKQQQYVENLLALLGLLQEDQILMRAEILRNLQRFDECIELLSNAESEEENIAKQMLAHAKKHNALVFKLILR